MRTLFLLVATLLVAGCESRNVQTDLDIVDVNTGWYDLGVIETGENKIVPSVSFRLRNVSDRAISGVQIDAVFRNVGEEEIISEHYVPGIGSDTPLEAGATTDLIVLRSKFGYTGTESRLQMLENSHFVDARVTILGRHGRNNWASMGEYTIDRELLSE